MSDKTQRERLTDQARKLLWDLDWGGPPRENLSAIFDVLQAAEAATVERLPCYHVESGWADECKQGEERFCPRCAALRELKGEGK